MKSMQDILDQIKSLTQEQGYIYALCLIVFDDVYPSIDELENINFNKKLSYNEIALLLGYLCQDELDFNYPKSSIGLIQMRDRTYDLLHKLHLILIREQKNKLKKLKLRTTPFTVEENIDFYLNDQAIVEPIFYSGDCVYDFQYLEYLPKRYKYDLEWLKKNKGYSVNFILGITNSLKTIITKQIYAFKSIQNNISQYTSSKPEISKFEQYQCFFYNLETITIENENWSLFYDNLLFMITFCNYNFENSKAFNSFIDNFSCSPNTIFNKEFNLIGDYNEILSKPILRLDEKRFLLPVHYLLAQAIYESPYYWMITDRKYKDTFAKHIGDVGEEITYDFLVNIFGENNTYQSVKIQSSKACTETDIDILCIFKNIALCVQVKSKKFTLKSKKGNVENILKDFKGAIQDAFNQGVVSKNNILGHKAILLKKDKSILEIPTQIDQAFVMGITTENYPTLLHQISLLLKKSPSDPYPLFTSIFDLELLTYYLNDPYVFLHYIKTRTENQEYFKAENEIHHLSLYLDQNISSLNIYDKVAIDNSYAIRIDQDYTRYKQTNQGILKDELDKQHKEFNLLLSNIKEFKHSKTTNIIFHLLDLSIKDRITLLQSIEKSKKQVLKNNSISSICLLPTNANWGISYICSSKADLIKEVNSYAILRKYKSKKDFWISLGCSRNSTKMFDIINYYNAPWIYDSQLNDITASLFNNRSFMLKGINKKIGRNDKCSCGSNIKYKSVVEDRSSVEQKNKV